MHWKYSNLRKPDATALCPWAVPDWKWSFCPDIYRKINGDKEDWTDFVSLVEGINHPDVLERELYAMRHLNIPQIVNEMAAQTAILQQVIIENIAE